MHFGVSFKVLFGENVTIELHFTVLGRTDVRIPNSFLENAVDGFVHLGHPEPLPLGCESDRDRGRGTRMFFDFWWVADSHILRPLLGIGLLRLMVLDND